MHVHGKICYSYIITLIGMYMRGGRLNHEVKPIDLKAPRVYNQINHDKAIV